MAVGTLDSAAQDQIRQRQLALLTQLEQAAAGNGPSAAQAIFQKTLDQAIATAKTTGGQSLS